MHSHDQSLLCLNLVVNAHQMILPVMPPLVQRPVMWAMIPGLVVVRGLGYTQAEGRSLLILAEMVLVPVAVLPEPVLMLVWEQLAPVLVRGWEQYPVGLVLVLVAVLVQQHVVLVLVLGRQVLPLPHLTSQHHLARRISSSRLYAFPELSNAQLEVVQT